MAILLWVGGRVAQWLVGLCMLGFLFYFNLHESVDSWALYFFGSYGLGAFAWWAGHSRHAGKWLGMLAVAGAAALLWDFRLRIALALLVALGLGVARWRMGHNSGGAQPTRKPMPLRVLRLLGRSSYALFLTHFTVVLLANVLWVRLGWAMPGAAAWFMAAAWIVCVAISLLFERHVERPLSAIRIPV